MSTTTQTTTAPVAAAPIAEGARGIDPARSSVEFPV
jgi:hypothetical protein